MIECDYSIDLELRICREFRGMPENHLRFLWCDGLDPEQYLLDGPSPCITGRAWICNGQLQDQRESGSCSTIRSICLPRSIGRHCFPAIT
jgi:hypothetical protein